MIGNQKKNSIEDKMAGRQKRLLLFFVVPVLIFSMALLIYGYTTGIYEQAENEIVQLESGRIELQNLADSPIRYRIQTLEEGIVFYDSIEEAKPLFGLFSSLQTKSINHKRQFFTVRSIPLWLGGRECDAKCFINITSFLRTILTGLFLIAMVYVCGTLLYLAYCKKKLHELLKPLKKIAAILNRMTAKNLHTERLGILDVSDEIRDLSMVCNEMLDRIESAYESQKQFVSNASHELRTPIAVVQGYANLLERWGANDPEVLEEAVTALCKVSKEMQELVEKLLFLSRHDRKTLQLKREVFDMKEVVEEVYQETRLVTKDRQLDCETKGKEEGVAKEEVLVYGDKQVMKQAIRIFMDNAIKYTKENDHIHIGCKSNGNECEIMISDTGIGMKKKDMQQIFNRFYRSDEVRGQNIAGHGLGLSIAKLIIFSHGGHIHVRSQYQKGTTFYLYLKLFHKSPT